MSMRYGYCFSDGTIVTSCLEQSEMMRRMNRLAALMVMTEQHEEGHGASICQKASRAYHQLEGFTGVIRLTSEEKDWLAYKLENEYLSKYDKEVIKFYCRIE